MRFFDFARAKALATLRMTLDGARWNSPKKPRYVILSGSEESQATFAALEKQNVLATVPR
jgi:hypothetical protein